MLNYYPGKRGSSLEAKDRNRIQKVGKLQIERDKFADKHLKWATKIELIGKFSNWNCEFGEGFALVGERKLFDRGSIFLFKKCFLNLTGIRFVIGHRAIKEGRT